MNKLPSTIVPWDQMKATPTAIGLRRDVVDGPTATLDKLHCHVTTLNPGESSGLPSRHLHEEMILIQDGIIEVTLDGRTQTVGAGSILFFTTNAVTALRNAGDAPATYAVIHFFTPLTPNG